MNESTSMCFVYEKGNEAIQVRYRMTSRNNSRYPPLQKMKELTRSAFGLEFANMKTFQSYNLCHIVLFLDTGVKKRIVQCIVRFTLIVPLFGLHKRRMLRRPYPST